MLLFDIVFNGNDTMYAEAVEAVDAAIAKYGEDKAVGFPDTAYTLACYYAETGTKITTLKEAKEALCIYQIYHEERETPGFRFQFRCGYCFIRRADRGYEVHRRSSSHMRLRILDICPMHRSVSWVFPL